MKWRRTFVREYQIPLTKGQWCRKSPVKIPLTVDHDEFAAMSYHRSESSCRVRHHKSSLPWWRLQMKTLSALLALCAGNSTVTGEFPARRQVTRSFDVFFDLRRHRAHYDVIVTRWHFYQPNHIIQIPASLPLCDFVACHSSFHRCQQHEKKGEI